jgi:hypothetical protein
MRTRASVVTGVLVAAVTFTSACSDVAPTEPFAADVGGPQLFRGTTQDMSQFVSPLEAAFLQIAKDVPGFGGLFYDQAGALNVYLTADAQPQATRALGGHLAALQVDPEAQPVRVRRGEYDFIQLNAMHQRARVVLGLGGVVFTDADEARNRLVVGVENDAAAADVENALAILGIPREAVIIQRTGRIELDQGLRDAVRPIPGGVQIGFDRDGSTFICTLGFNVRAPAAPNVRGFVTNSHCSRARSQMLSTPYWQPSRTAANFIGEEVHDLPFHSGGDCPAGRVCRYSDALGVQYAAAVPTADIDFGRIARTTFSGTTEAGSLQIDPANPRWQIVAENVTMVGQELHKTVRTSGWTRGPVTATCVNTNLSPNITLFCQDRITNLRQGGDSGSPYYRRIGEGNDVALAGVHWGGSGFDAIMSPIQNIRFENQGPAPWTTYPGQTP